LVLEYIGPSDRLVLVVAACLTASPSFVFFPSF